MKRCTVASSITFNNRTLPLGLAYTPVGFLVPRPPSACSHYLMSHTDLYLVTSHSRKWRRLYARTCKIAIDMTNLLNWYICYYLSGSDLDLTLYFLSTATMTIPFFYWVDKHLSWIHKIEPQSKNRIKWCLSYRSQLEMSDMIREPFYQVCCWDTIL